MKSLINETAPITLKTTQTLTGAYSHGHPVKSYDDGEGPLWIVLEACGHSYHVSGIVRARSWETAWEIAEDEIFASPSQEDMDGWFDDYDIPTVDDDGNPLTEDERWELLHDDGAWKESHGFRNNADCTVPGGQYYVRDYDTRMDPLCVRHLDDFESFAVALVIATDEEHLPYSLTLDHGERKALDWIGNRYSHGSDLAWILNHSYSNVSEDDCPWDETVPIRFQLEESEAWEIAELLEGSMYECLSPDFASKLQDFVDSIV